MVFYIYTHTHTHTHTYIYIYILPSFIYIGLIIYYIELTHLTQKFKNFRLDGTCGIKLNSNFYTKLVCNHMHMYGYN